MTTYNYSTSEINRDWRLKVHGMHNGKKLNTLVGVSGMIEIFGVEFANKFTQRAYESMADVCTCKLRRGIKITFYGK